MEQCPEWAKPNGQILYFGVAPRGKTIKLNPFDIYKKELKIMSSFTSKRNTYQALELLRQGKIAVKNLISHKLPLKDFYKGINLIEKGIDKVMKILIIPGA